MFKQRNNLLAILAVITLLFASGGTYGRTNMSILLVDEQFEDDNYTSRGWNDNTIGSQSGYGKENDPNFGRVMYNQWSGTGGDGGAMADGVNNGAMFPLSRSQMDTGVTIYWASKWSNMMNNRATSDATHNGVRGNFGQKVMGHVDGEWLLDMLASGSGIRSANGQFYDRAMNVVPQYPNYAPDRIPYLDTVSGGGLVKTSNGPSYLEDGKWYEFVLYMEPNNAGANGRSILWHREFGVSNWTQDWDVTQQVCKRVGNEGMVGIGTYLHSRNGTASAPVRAYWGRFSVWEGNAMEDGSVDKLIDGNGGITDPVEPPVDPVEPPTGGELAITDLTVVSSRTAATISWKTNKPSNSVMDYGDTAARGNMVRDDAMVTDHALNIGDLTEGTTYYFRVSSRTTDGETFLVEENQTFDTDVTVVEPPKPEIPDGHIVVLEKEPKAGQGVIYDGEKWVAIDLEAEIIKILQERTKLKVS